MFHTPRAAAVACSLFFLPRLAVAAEPVKYIAVYVLPYYESAQSQEGRPRVAVNGKYDALLSSSAQKDVAAVRDMIQREPQMVTPMTLMVLAIRLYDVGLRDDSVFWFYAAKDRYVTLSEVLDLDAPAMAQVREATQNFAQLAGPTINGYAFCSIKKQKELRAKALVWVTGNPYEALFLPQLPAKPGDRHANLKSAMEKIRGLLREEQAYLDKPENAEKLTRARRENHADEMYCW